MVTLKWKMLPFQLRGLAVRKENAASCTDILKNELYLQRTRISRKHGIH